jgi:hypothetical protein
MALELEGDMCDLNSHHYVASIYWAMTTALTIGYGPNPNPNPTPNPNPNTIPNPNPNSNLSTLPS